MGANTVSEFMDALDKCEHFVYQTLMGAATHSCLAAYVGNGIWSFMEWGNPHAEPFTDAKKGDFGIPDVGTMVDLGKGIRSKQPFHLLAGSATAWFLPRGGNDWIVVKAVGVS